MLFTPEYIFEKTTNITPRFLSQHGIKNLLLDVDNTLTTHDNPVPADGIAQWLQTMRDNGIGMVIISNNDYDRVKPFADMLGLPFVCDGAKPLTKGNKEGLKFLGATKNNTATVGDQIFTDLLGARLIGTMCLLTVPIEPEKTTFFKIKRFLEKGPIRRYFRKGGKLL